MGGDAPAHAARAATTTIPVVFAVTADPVKSGLVTSINRPGGNLTGVNFLLNMIPAKQFEVLHETVPKANVIGFLINPSGPEARATAINDVQAAAQTLGHELFVAKASSERDIDAAFAELAQRRVGAILVGNDVFFYSRREQIVALAARHTIPAIYNVREFAQAGGLMSYGQRRRRATPRRRLRRPHSPRREGCRSARPAGGEGRAGAESENRQDAWHHLPALAARPRRRSHRIERLLAAVHESCGKS